MSATLIIEPHSDNLWILGRDFAFKRQPGLRVKNGGVLLEAKVVETEGPTTFIRIEGQMRDGGFYSSGQFWMVGKEAA